MREKERSVTVRVRIIELTMDKRNSEEERARLVREWDGAPFFERLQPVHIVFRCDVIRRKKNR